MKKYELGQEVYFVQESQRDTKCKKCNGLGINEDDWRCPDCYGHGEKCQTVRSIKKGVIIGLLLYQRYVCDKDGLMTKEKETVLNQAWKNNPITIMWGDAYTTGKNGEDIYLTEEEAKEARKEMRRMG